MSLRKDANKDSFKVNIIDDSEANYDSRHYCPHDYHALIFRAEYKNYWCPQCTYIDKGKQETTEQQQQQQEGGEKKKFRIVTASGYTSAGKNTFTNDAAENPENEVFASPINTKNQEFEDKLMGAARLGYDDDLRRLESKGYNIVSSYEQVEEVDTFNPSQEQ